MQSIPRLLRSMSVMDRVLVALLVATVLGAVVLELRVRRLSRDFASALQSERGTLFMLAVFAFAGSRFYLAPGEFAYGDAIVHVSRIYEAARSLIDGSRPDWSFSSYAGYPLLQFYSPLLFWLGGMLFAIVEDAHNAAKILLFLLHFSSGFALYAWARAAGLSRRAGFVAAIAYVLSFQHTHLLLWAGALPVAPLFVLVPLFLCATEKIICQRGGRWIWLLGISTGGMVLSHHGHAAFTLQLAAVYICARIAFVAHSRIRPILRIGMAVVGGMLLSSELLWSIAREGSWIYHPEGLPILRPALSIPYLTRMVRWSNHWSGFTGAYAGVTLLVFAVLGMVSVGRRVSITTATRGEAASSSVDSYASARAAIAMFLVALVCAEIAGGRVGNWMLPPLSLLAGLGVEWAVNRKSPRRRERPESDHDLGHPASMRMAFFLVALILLDVGSTSIQSNFRADRRRLTDGLETVASSIGSSRALLAYRNALGQTEFFEFLAEAGDVPRFPIGGYPQGAPRSLNSQLTMIDELNKTPDTLETSDLDLLRLWDVSTLLTVSRSDLVPPNIEGAEDRSVRSVQGSETPFAYLPAGPLIFAPEARIAAPSDFTRMQGFQMQTPSGEEFRPSYAKEMLLQLREMRIDREASRADFLPLFPGTGLMGATSGSLGSDGDRLEPLDPGSKSNPSVGHPAGDLFEPAVTVISYEVEQRRATIEYEAAQPGYLRLAFSWYPTLAVTIDGKITAPARGLFGGIVVVTPAGRHVIELLPTRTLERNLISWLGSLLGVALIGATAWKTPKGDNPPEGRLPLVA